MDTTKDHEAERRIFATALRKVKKNSSDINMRVPDESAMSCAKRKSRFRVNRSLPYSRSAGYSHVYENSDGSSEAEWKHDLYEGNNQSDCAGSQIFIRNLPTSITQQQLKRLFSSVGKVMSIKLDSGPLTTARINFSTKAAAEDAIQKYHGYLVQNKPIKVSVYRSLEMQQKNCMSINSLQKFNRDSKQPSSGSSGYTKLQSETPQLSVFDRMS